MLRGLFCKKNSLLIVVALFLVAIFSYHEKDRYGGELSKWSRSLIGNEKTLKFEGWYFSAQDKADRLKFSVFGGKTKVFSENSFSKEFLPEQPNTADQESAWFDTRETWEDYYVVLPEPSPPPKPAPLALPKTDLFFDSPQQGEGLWTTEGLPHTSPEDLLMAKVFVRPDPVRPYAVVQALILDKRRIRLHVVGSGKIPDEDKGNLLVAWNGGFQLGHALWGMYADQKPYKPLLPGYASLVLSKDGTFRIGTWGTEGFGFGPDVAAVRQNGRLLVENCAVNNATASADPNIWGRVEDKDTASFITSRSAIGLTESGDLLVADGSSLTAQTLARALKAVGACWAMQLDINASWIITSLFYYPEKGPMIATKFMPSMIRDPKMFLSNQSRDFMYLTLDETNYN